MFDYVDDVLLPKVARIDAVIAESGCCGFQNETLSEGCLLNVIEVVLCHFNSFAFTCSSSCALLVGRVWPGHGPSASQHSTSLKCHVPVLHVTNAVSYEYFGKVL